MEEGISNKYSTIELLVVILVIGVLLAVSVIFLNNSRQIARDAKRQVDMRRLQTAFEFYKIENGSYPTTNSAIVLGEEPFVKLCDAASGGLVASTVSCTTEFMAPIPAEPLPGKSYLYTADEKGFTIGFETETKTDLGAGGWYYAHAASIDRDSQPK